MLKNCTMCNTVYEGYIDSKYCSVDCKELYDIYESENKKNETNNTDENIIQVKEENIVKIYKKMCKNCGAEFDGYKSSLYCSSECKKEYNKNKDYEINNKPFEPRSLNNNLAKNNTSGYRGVYFDEAKQKWRSQIRFNKKCHKLGLYENKLEAIKSRQKAELEFYGKILDNENFEVAEFNDIINYITSMTDARLIQISNQIYDYINNDFLILYKQFEEKISSIEELQNLFLQETSKRFYKLNKISKMIDNNNTK